MKSKKTIQILMILVSVAVAGSVFAQPVITQLPPGTQIPAGTIPVPTTPSGIQLNTGNNQGFIDPNLINQNLVTPPATPPSPGWNPPSGNAPSGNVDAPVHTGVFGQIKKGWLRSDTSFAAPFGGFNSLWAGIDALLPSAKGWFVTNGIVQFKTGVPAVAGQALVATDTNGTIGWGTASGSLPPGQLDQTLRHDGTTWVAASNFLNRQTYMANDGNFVNRGNLIVRAKPNYSGGDAAVTINLEDNTGPKGRDALFINTSADNTAIGAYLKTNANSFNFLSTTGNKPASLYSGAQTINLFGLNGSAGSDAIKITPAQNVPATLVTEHGGFQFWDNKDGSNGGRAKIYADQVQLTGGNPGVNKVLASTSNNGDAEWKNAGDLLSFPSSQSATIKRIIEYKGSNTGKTKITAGAYCFPGELAIGGGVTCQSSNDVAVLMRSDFHYPDSGPNKGREGYWGTCGVPGGVNLTTDITASVTVKCLDLQWDKYLSSSSQGVSVGSNPGGSNPVTPPTDVCPNIAGAQATVPAGYHMFDGNCITNPTANWNNTTGNGTINQTCRQWLVTKNPSLPGFIDSPQSVQARSPLSAGSCAYATAPSTQSSGLTSSGNCVIKGYDEAVPGFMPVNSCYVKDSQGLTLKLFSTEARHN